MEEAKKQRKKSVVLTKRQRKNAVRLVEDGVSQDDVAALYRVTIQTINKIYWAEKDPNNERYRRSKSEGFMTPEQIEAVSAHERKNAIGWEERREKIRMENDERGHLRQNWRSQTTDEAANTYPRNHDWARNHNQDRAGGGTRLMNTRVLDEPEIMRPDSDDDRVKRWRSLGPQYEV